MELELPSRKLNGAVNRTKLHASDFWFPPACLIHAQDGHPANGEAIMSLGTILIILLLGGFIGRYRG
jgi:hypothetical protein